MKLRIIFGIIGVLFAQGCLFGCAARGKVKAAAISLDKEAGGNINEPVTGWILAIGYAVTPISFLLYVLTKRTRLYRALAGRCPPDTLPGGT